MSEGCSGSDKEGAASLSSMHKRAGFILLLGASVGALAAGTMGTIELKKAPMPVRAASVAPLAAAVQLTTTPPPVNAAVASSIARWNSLRQSDNLPFSSYASFLHSHRGWPGETAMRRTAERQADPGTTSASEVMRFFREFPPLTPTGKARFAFALHASGQVDQARAMARDAWTSGVLNVNDEARLLATFGGALTPADHERRMEVLLANGDTQTAQRMLAWTPAQRRPVFEARLALQTRAPDAAARGQALGDSVAGDPGFLVDRANWMRNSGNPGGARQLLAQRRNLTSRPANPAKFMETMFQMARGAANDRQWSTAWQIASQVDDIYPPGTDISAQPFADRDQYTNLTWLAGTAALQQLGRAQDAIGMFERYGRAAQSPQTQTKGLYWAGRAAVRAGQIERAQAYFREAGRHYDQFYGQLAVEHLGQALPAPGQPELAPPSSADREAFYNPPNVAAIRYLGQTGQYRDQSAFIRALADQVETDQERLMAVDLGQRIGRQDLGVIVARQARANGSFDYKRWGFPQVPVPAAQRANWTMVHAITRQESLFDREAVSHAGARGLMQLMPGTAREQAGRLSLPYEQARLTRDPDYNVMLGSTYFQRLLNQWGGSYPLAIASYNAGAGNVQRWIRENGDPRTPGVDMIEWIEKIPFFETRNYVQRVIENAVVYDLMHPDRSGSPPRNRVSFYLGQRVAN
jgi:soluble lytic murein transglycosylase